MFKMKDLFAVKKNDVTQDEQKVINDLNKAHNILLEIIPEYKDVPLYFAGGCIASILQDETPRDYDIFFNVRDIYKEYSKICKPLDLRCAERTPFGFKLYASYPHSHTFNIITNGFYGSPATIINEFDLVHCQTYYVPGERVRLTKEVLNTIKSKQLILTSYWGKQNIEWSLRRISKFIDRGYKLDKSEYITAMSKTMTNMSAYRFFKMLDAIKVDS